MLLYTVGKALSLVTAITSPGLGPERAWCALLPTAHWPLWCRSRSQEQSRPTLPMLLGSPVHPVGSGQYETANTGHPAWQTGSRARVLHLSGGQHTAQGLMGQQQEWGLREEATGGGYGRRLQEEAVGGGCVLSRGWGHQAAASGAPWGPEMSRQQEGFQLLHRAMEGQHWACRC